MRNLDLSKVTRGKVIYTASPQGVVRTFKVIEPALPKRFDASRYIVISEVPTAEDILKHPLHKWELFGNSIPPALAPAMLKHPNIIGAMTNHHADVMFMMTVRDMDTNVVYQIPTESMVAEYNMTKAFGKKRQAIAYSQYPTPTAIYDTLEELLDIE